MSAKIIKVSGLSHDGRGIASIDGKVTFIEGALPGEEVTACLLRKHQKFDEARIVDLINPANKRVIPACIHFSICGGCSLQHMRHDLQLEMKQQTLLEQLQHFGNLQPKIIIPPLLGKVWHYRRKARLSVKYVAKKRKVLVGFHEKNGRYIADLETCEILPKSIALLIKPLSQLIETLSIYQHIPQIEVAVGDNITIFVFRNLQAFTENDLILLTEFGRQHDIHIYLQPGNAETVHILYPEHPVAITYNISDYNIEIAFDPLGFIQINQKLNEQMINLAINLLDLKNDDHILDLFCGVGNFTLPIAQQCKYVVGIEGSEHAVNQAKQNAARNNIGNVEFHSYDLSNDYSTTNWGQQEYTKVLLDPPRTGAFEAIRYFSKINPKKIVYVSCNPATFARDAGELARQGFGLDAVGIMDMFPQTKHTEVIGLFTSKIRN